MASRNLVLAASGGSLDLKMEKNKIPFKSDTVVWDQRFELKPNPNPNPKPEEDSLMKPKPNISILKPNLKPIQNQAKTLHDPVK